jgi:hypothetical protein
VIAGHRPGVRFLRDATVDDLEQWGHEIPRIPSSEPATSLQKTCAPWQPPNALIRGDLPELGRLMAEAHLSYSQDFEASCIEADTMVNLAQDLPASSAHALPAAASAAAPSTWWSKTTPLHSQRLWPVFTLHKSESCLRFTSATRPVELTSWRSCFLTFREIIPKIVGQYFIEGNSMRLLLSAAKFVPCPPFVTSSVVTLVPNHPNLNGSFERTIDKIEQVSRY